MPSTIVFCFAGRQANMQLQLPLMRRILAENPDVQYHIWNLSRNEQDSRYLKRIKGERITVINDFHAEHKPYERFNDVFRHYANPKFKDHLFVKLDDDVVFLETDRFADFIEAVDTHRDSVVSAKVINNGACTPTEPNLWAVFKWLNTALLDVHLSTEYAMLSHNYMFEHWPDLVDQPIELIETRDWLSINLIGYDWPMACRIAEQVGGPSPRHIAGRDFSGFLGDEGMVNTLPRLIMQGFLACHLYFGPQASCMDGEQLTLLRKNYAEVARLYLDT